MSSLIHVRAVELSSLEAASFSGLGSVRDQQVANHWWRGGQWLGVERHRSRWSSFVESRSHWFSREQPCSFSWVRQKFFGIRTFKRVQVFAKGDQVL